MLIVFFMSPEPLIASSDLKAVLFTVIPFHSISPAINAGDVRFPDVDVTTDSWALHLEDLDMNRQAFHDDRLRGDRQRLLCFVGSLGM